MLLTEISIACTVGLSRNIQHTLGLLDYFSDWLLLKMEYVRGVVQIYRPTVSDYPAI
jgi:hypothetical protein